MTRIWPSARDAIAHAGAGAVAPLAADPARHLLSRFAFGPTTAELRRVRAGVDAWWAGQIAFGRKYGGYAASARLRAVGTYLGQTPAQVRSGMKSAEGNEYSWTAMNQLSQVTLGLQTWSQAQVYETVVDFFANHLNVANHNGDLWNCRHTFDRDVVRRYAFGRYSDMLQASARNPAMLIYLNNTDSNGGPRGTVNENYGRELLELHTVGAGNYTETDVKNSAKIMSGRRANVNIDATAPYYFDARRHYAGAVQVMGFTHANTTAAGGEAVGDAYLDYLAHHPATAKRLATKLCQRFVSDTPSAELIALVAQAYLASGTDIVATVTAIVHSDEFWASRGRKVRRPTENLIATIRVLDITPTAHLADALSTLHWMSASVGNLPLDWSPPNGYPDLAKAWRSSGTLLKLWQYHTAFGYAGWWSDPKKRSQAAFTTPTVASMYAGAKPRTTGQAIDALTRRLTGTVFGPTARNGLLAFLGETANTPFSRSKLAWALGPVTALILHSPQHALR